MLRIGLTGGIGSGKTVCSKIFSMLGVPVFNSDVEARRLMETDHELKVAMKSLFNASFFLPSGLPDRKKIAELVFAEPAKLKELNSLVHPAVFRAFDAWVKEHQDLVPYILKEAAILFESGAATGTDYSILVWSEPEMRMKRVLLRDNSTREQVLNRIARQMPDEEKMKLANYIIYNDERHSVLEQVIKLDALFRTVKFLLFILVTPFAKYL